MEVVCNFLYFIDRKKSYKKSNTLLVDHEGGGAATQTTRKRSDLALLNRQKVSNVPEDGPAFGKQNHINERFSLPNVSGFTGIPILLCVKWTQAFYFLLS